MIGIENPVFHVRRPMKRFITVEMFRKKKKKVKPSKELLTFLSFTETTENFLYHCCTWITNARPPPERKRKIYLFFFFFFIAQNAYCSRDIYFQFNKVCRSVISCVDAMKAPQRLVALNAFGCSFKYDVGGKPNKGGSSLLFLLLFANRTYAHISQPHFKNALLL